MTPVPVGYSGTPLARKLGITEGAVVVTIAAPADYPRWLAPMPRSVRFDTSPSRETDVVHLFTASRRDLAKRLASLRKTIRGDTALWVSWPKKSSKVETDVTEDVIRGVALPLGFVDIKVCAVTEVWSGLKLVIRKELR